MLTPKCWRRHASAVGYAVVRVLPMTYRNSAALRVRQSSGRVALNLVVWTLRSRTAESYANAGVRPVAITTPEHSYVGIGYRHGGLHLLSIWLPPPGAFYKFRYVSLFSWSSLAALIASFAARLLNAKLKFSTFFIDGSMAGLITFSSAVVNWLSLY